MTVLWIVGGLLLLVTALPFLPADSRFVRVWDFPRAQIAFLLALVLIASIVAVGVNRWWALVWHGALVLALCYQLYRIYPYTRIHHVEALDANEIAQPGATTKLRLLVANVRQSNRESAPLLREITEQNPDAILLLETDAWWAEQVAPLRQEYAYVVAQPQDDAYGMLLLSRLELIDPKVRFLLEDYVPSIQTGVRLASGDVIDFHGVHPKPPPLDDTEQRNAELLIVGRQVRNETTPAVVAGDLNDVAWSDTTRLFQKVSGLLDPRIGRGLYSTYNANWRIMRWPLDHVFFENTFTLVAMRRLGHIGSDHFPFYIELCYQPQAETRQETPAPDEDEMERAKEAIRDGREEARDRN